MGALNAHAASVGLTVSGTNSGSGEQTIVSNPSSHGGGAEVHFGSIITFLPNPTTGKAVRLVSHRSSRLVATLNATANLVNIDSATIEIERSDTNASLPSTRLRWASGKHTDWRQTHAGTVLSSSKQILAATALSGQANIHEIAIELNDSDVAGPKFASIKYTITANP